VLSPGWSSYEWRSATGATTSLPFSRSTSVLAFSLGNGWYLRRLSWNGHRDFYGDRLGLIAQLEVVFADGHRQVVVTDETWAAGPSDVLADDLYDGQTIDARLRDDSWLRPGPTPAGWVGVEAVPFDVQRLAPYVGPPVVRHESRRPVEIWTSPSGRTLVDFGQNLVGWLRFTVRGEAGHEITLRHARCSSTASWASARCGPPRPPTGSCSAGATTASSRPRRSTGSGTPRSPVGRAP
jgi:alpha-L-rhamnosidase